MSTSARRTRKILGVVAAAVLGFAGLALATNPTGAWFTDTKSATAMAQTGNAAINLSDASHSATCVLNFGTVNPGHSSVASCTVKNTGSTPLKITISDVGTPSVTAPHASPVNTIDGTKYSVSIDGYLPDTSLSAFAAPVDLGTLNPGDSRTYETTYTVADTVGNEGQDLQLSISFKVTGTQY